MASARPAPSSENARRTMQANRRVSNAELRFRRALRKAGLAGYRTSLRLPGRPDIVFTRGRVAVFVHGCFWHSCSACDLPRPKAHSEFWNAKFEENRRRDAKAELDLTDAGWTPVVVWEHDIRGDLDSAVRRLAEVIRSHRGES